MRTSSTTDVLSLQRRQLAAAGGVLWHAFDEDPLWAALLPDPEERLRTFPRIWAGVIRYCLRYGRVDTTVDLQGVACWSQPGKAHPTTWRMLRSGGGLMRAVMVLSPQSRKRFTTALGWLEAHHRKTMSSPHWYLWALGVDPASQGKGIGSALLQPVLRKASKDGIPCYLETQTERNVQFYRRQGFEVLQDVEIPDIDLKVWCMGRH